MSFTTYALQWSKMLTLDLSRYWESNVNPFTDFTHW
nr:MAG TPA: hypothetical protein [Bacteriophage sp.]DAS92807.1 MAG TPA: hypothetical protein [Caudoviricetes sp.]DAY34923.1 MAG TPA: hypothetical protein [Bacteriophage sp.]